VTCGHIADDETIDIQPIEQRADDRQISADARSSWSVTALAKLVPAERAERKSLDAYSREQVHTWRRGPPPQLREAAEDVRK
jgi:hypothetical protein